VRRVTPTSKISTRSSKSQSVQGRRLAADNSADISGRGRSPEVDDGITVSKQRRGGQGAAVHQHADQRRPLMTPGGAFCYCQLSGACLSVGRGVFASWAG
jgi:hypothetical protein